MSLAEIAGRVLASGAQLVGVTGPDGAGKTRFAAGLAQALRGQGRAVLAASVDDFHNPRALRYARGRTSPEGFYRDTTNLAALRADLLDPLAAGGSRIVRTAVFDHRADRPVDAPWVVVPVDTILVLEGIFLIRPELAGCLDFVIYLDVPFAETFARMARLDGTDPDPYAEASERYRRGRRYGWKRLRPRRWRIWWLITGILGRPGWLGGGYRGPFERGCCAALIGPIAAARKRKARRVGLGARVGIGGCLTGLAQKAPAGGRQAPPDLLWADRGRTVFWPRW